MSSEFKSDKYGIKFAKNQISPTATRWFWWCRPALNPLKGVFSIGKRPLNLGKYMLSKKLLVDIGVETFAAKIQSSVA
jgi:hypothetical protein